MLSSISLSFCLRTSMAFLTMATGERELTDSTLKIYLSFFLPMRRKFLRLFMSKASAVFLHSPQKMHLSWFTTSKTPSWTSKTLTGQESRMAYFCWVVRSMVSSVLISGSGWKVARETGDHLACILPMPFWTSKRILTSWFLASLTMGMPIFSSLLRLEQYCTGCTGRISSSSDLSWSNTDRICSEVTSMTSSLVFLASSMKQALQIWQSSTLFSAQVHSQGYLKSLTASLTKGMSPILWQRNQSCRTEVFSMMLTRCGARVGTSEIMILLSALARLTSQPVSANLMLSWLMSRISVLTFSIILLLFEVEIQQNQDSIQISSPTNQPVLRSISRRGRQGMQ